MTDQLSKKITKGCKNSELKKLGLLSACPGSQVPHRKQPRKGDNPGRPLLATEVLEDNACMANWVCKNSACRAILNSEDTFCKRCSCCICHEFDENKDPSLWLVCTSESKHQDSCGLSCHIECALQHHKVGVVDLGQLMHLDGSYCCASCGKISGIIGSWKKQLMIAKEARRVDVLCYRISLSYRLLDGTNRFKELHDIVSDAKAKLEVEVGPMNCVSFKMVRGIVSRLSVGSEVQKLCILALDKVDELLNVSGGTNPEEGDGSLPAACKFHFEDVTSSSIVIILKEYCYSPPYPVKGYKLWYWRAREEQDLHQMEPVVFPRSQRKIQISGLQPCTEYSFRIISFTESGNLGHSEAKCFTKSVEIIPRNSTAGIGRKNENVDVDGSSSSARRYPEISSITSPRFKVRDLGNFFRVAAEHGGLLDMFCSVDGEECCDVNCVMKPESIVDAGRKPYVQRGGLDLNVSSVPDLNAELVSPLEEDCHDEDEEDIVSRGMERNGRSQRNGSGDSETWPIISHTEKRKPSLNEEAFDGDSTLINGSPIRLLSQSGELDGSYEYCVKMIRCLEREGHIEKDFRMKFLTWFSLRSTEQERRVVHTYIRTMNDDPNSLADQLVDSFHDIVSSKRPRNGFCGMLWH
ncbi:VIN3-like protein 1 [Acorus gramineus]|uniref:VIN3-like protein 1 n=1 Tax=Acorus gramineus TaxID=55184 RepID=A0AAV9AHA0_ACOGR|nr:VIN3-like protein 1 [Acorus gramineus]